MTFIAYFLHFPEGTSHVFFNHIEWIVYERVKRAVLYCWRGFWQHSGAFRGSTKKLYSEKLVVVYCWRDFWQHLGAPLRSFFLRIYRVYCDWASDRIQFFRNLSGISHLGFQQNLKFAEASGDLSKPDGVSVL